MHRFIHLPYCEQVNDPQKAVSSGDPEIALKLKEENERLRAEAVAAKDRAAQLESEKAEVERQRLEEEGNWKAIAERESARAEAAEAARMADKSEFAKRQIASELRARLASEGVEDPDFALLANREMLKYEDGAVVGLDDCIKDLRERKPHIFRGRSSTASATTPAPSGVAAPPKTVKEMNDVEYAKYKRDIVRSFKRH